jgi:ABC-type lipoprotein release transport system permease subunit
LRFLSRRRARSVPAFEQAATECNSGLIGAVAGLLSALRAARLSPTEALRTV